jgi:hypothetical protein
MNYYDKLEKIEKCKGKLEGISNPEIKKMIINSCKVDYSLEDSDLRQL